MDVLSGSPVMKKISRIGMVSLVALLGVSAPLAAQQKKSFIQSAKEFLSKNKSKIAAGVAAAAAIGLTVALGYHANKTMNAIEKAGLKPSDELFSDAVAAVGLLGPLGMDRTIKLMQKAIDRNLITTEEASVLVLTDIGKALANYWGVKHAEYVAKAGFSRFRGAVKRAKQEAEKAVNALKSALRF